MTACLSLSEEEQYKLLKLNQTVEESDMTVEQLVGRMQEATDPKALFKTAKSYLLKQTFISEKDEKSGKYTAQYSNTVKFRVPDEMVQISERAGSPIRMIYFKQGAAYMVDPDSKKSYKVKDGKELNLIKTYSDLANLTKSITDIFASVEIGILYENKTRYYRLVCRTEDPAIAPYVIYINGETFLTERVETIMYGEYGMQLLYVAEPKDYKWFNGVLIPTSTITQVGKNVDICNTNSFVLN